MHAKVDAPRNVACLWVDDGVNPDYTMNLAPGWLDELDYPKHFGFDICCDFDEGWAATEVWLDELVMDSKRIHCQ